VEEQLVRPVLAALDRELAVASVTPPVKFGISTATRQRALRLIDVPCP
jgi:hypothetical protein